ncbi:MAG: glycosyltransferase family 4 protein [Pseudomonadota bacterium]
MTPHKPGTIAVFLKGYPRLSETFIAQEILNLQKAGLELHLVSLRHPTDTKRHPVHFEITAPVTYLPEYVHDEWGRSLRAWRAARRLPGYGKAFKTWLRDLRRDRTRNRLRRFVQAMVAATEVAHDPKVRWLYVHFIHTPGSVTRYAAMMVGKPYSISAHAKDIWTSPDWELNEKLDDARWTVTCTRGGADHLAGLASRDDKVKLLYHGLDLHRFPAPNRPPAHRTGGDPGDPLHILSVGRAVEKKGLDTLLRALALLPKDMHWRFTHIAGGPLLADLKALGEELGLSKRLTFLGSQAQSRVLAEYGEADLFVLPCRIAADGDRDGLPNVIVEAQSQAVPVISSPISGIPELIEEGANGLLVKPDQPEKLAQAIIKLAQDPARRDAMGREGMARVHENFNAAREIEQLLALFNTPS